MHWRACVGKAKPRTEAAPKGKAATSRPDLRRDSERRDRNAWGGWRYNGRKLGRHESGITIRERNGVHDRRADRRTVPESDRAFVRARKRGNACGAKEGRKVETTNKRMKETAPQMSCGLNRCRATQVRKPLNFDRSLLAALETRVNH